METSPRDRDWVVPPVPLAETKRVAPDVIAASEQAARSIAGSSPATTTPFNCSPGLVVFQGSSPQVRTELFHLDHAHHPLVGKLTIWGEWFYRKAIENSRKAGTWLVISGPVGTGKSTVSRRLARALSTMAVDASLGGWGGTVPGVWRGAWAALSSHDKNSEFEDGLTDLKTAHIVFLDDIGAEVDRFKQGETTSRLCRVLDMCQGKWLFITTNLDKPLIAAKYDHRVLDRMNMAHWCDLAGMPSYRSKIPKHEQ